MKLTTAQKACYMEAYRKAVETGDYTDVNTMVRELVKAGSAEPVPNNLCKEVLTK